MVARNHGRAGGLDRSSLAAVSRPDIELGSVIAGIILMDYAAAPAMRTPLSGDGHVPPRGFDSLMPEGSLNHASEEWVWFDQM